jgi:peptidoglycan/LPS O-acetylase OafA/YrhL
MPVYRNRSRTITAPRAQQLDKLTSLRFFAALAVFLHHVPSVGVKWPPLAGYASGNLGVPFFFVLSGFVLTWSFRPGMTARAFWWRRVARIYPTYAVTTLLAAALIATGLMAGVLNDYVLFLHLALVQTWSTHFSEIFALNSLSWTLSVEAFFYLSFPLLVWVLRRAGKLQRRAITAAVLAACFAGMQIGVGAGLYAVHPLMLVGEFTFGILLALELLDGWTPGVWATLTAATIVPALTIATFYPVHVGHYLLMPAFGAIIVLAATSDLAGRRSFLNVRAFVYLGEISFAFYLVHQLVLRVVPSHLGWAHPWPLGKGLVVVGCLFAAVLVSAMILHHAVELPFQKLLVRRPARPPANSPEPAVAPGTPAPVAGLGPLPVADPASPLVNAGETPA